MVGRWGADLGLSKPAEGLERRQVALEKLLRAWPHYLDHHLPAVDEPRPMALRGQQRVGGRRRGDRGGGSGTRQAARLESGGTCSNIALSVQGTGARANTPAQASASHPRPPGR